MYRDISVETNLDALIVPTPSTEEVEEQLDEQPN